jgi:hypothetical protein
MRCSEKGEREGENTILLVLPDRMVALQHDHNYKPEFTTDTVTLRYRNFSSLGNAQQNREPNMGIYGENDNFFLCY